MQCTALHCTAMDCTAMDCTALRRVCVRVLSAPLSICSTLADSPVTIYRKWCTSRAISTLAMHSALYYAYFIFSNHFFYDLNMYLYNSTLSYSILLSSPLLSSPPFSSLLISLLPSFPFPCSLLLVPSLLSYSSLLSYFTSI